MPDWKTSADTVIIGGGIMGCCLAYFLSISGQKNIVLLEKDLLARASTGLCVGGIRQQFSLPANILLSQRSLKILKDFEKEYQEDFEFHQDGYLFLVQRQETWKDFLSSVNIQKQYGVPVEVLTPGQISSRWPYLTVDDLQGGTFCPEDGYADPYRVAMAFAAQSRRRGVAIYEKTEVTGILTSLDRITGVKTSRGDIATPVVVNAAGAWAAEIARMTGLALPILPVRRQVFITKSFEAIPKPVPMVIDIDELFYFRGEHPGILTGMSDPNEPPGYEIHVDRDFLERIVEKAVHRVPVFAEAEILRGWAGLYAVTPDENPIIGPIPEAPGFFNMVGFSGHGFQHGPSVGRIMSKLILDGRTDFDLSPFSYTRFGKKKRTEEQRTV
jgi:sarcosine oxidase subunit beta